MEIDDDPRGKVCTACGTPLADAAGDGPPIGLIEDGVLLCRACAMEADRHFDLPPLDAA